MIRRLHKLPFLCLLVLCLLASPASSFGFVWCVSADGHVTLETALAGDCGMDAPLSPADDFADHLLAAQTDDCGPCHDISNAPSWGSARSRNTGNPDSLPAPLAPVIVATQLSLPERLLNNRPVAESNPRTPEPIRLHRTIVLLI